MILFQFPNLFLIFFLFSRKPASIVISILFYNTIKDFFCKSIYSLLLCAKYLNMATVKRKVMKKSDGSIDKRYLSENKVGKVGAKPKNDKAIPVQFYIKTSIVEKLGGIDRVRIIAREHCESIVKDTF